MSPPDLTPPRPGPTVVARNVAGFLVLAWTLVTTVALSNVTHPRRALPLLKALLRLMFWCFGLRIHTVGQDDLPTRTHYLYLANHTSWLDHFIALAVAPGYLIGLEKAESFRIPLYGRTIRRWGQIPIKREDPIAAREACRKIEEQIRHGVEVMLFPEGTRSKDGRLGTFKKGVFHIAASAKVDVVPVAFVGLWELAGAGRRLVRPGEVTVRFGAPITGDSVEGAELSALMHQVHDEIEHLLSRGHQGVSQRQTPREAPPPVTDTK